MGKIAKAFESQMTAILTEKIGRDLMRFQGGSACAGVVGNSDLQFKARINHYGGSFDKETVSLKETGQIRHGRPVIRSVKTKYVQTIPQRHFVEYAIPQDSELFRNFEHEVATILSGGTERVVEAEDGGGAHTSHQANFASGRRGPYRTLLAIAKEMKRNQVERIWTVGPPNAPRTIQRKGFDQPLVETGELVNGIKHWVEGFE